LQTGQVGPFGRIKAVSDHPAERETGVSREVVFQYPLKSAKEITEVASATLFLIKVNREILEIVNGG
jgi:hypothetical protein